MHEAAAGSVTPAKIISIMGHIFCNHEYGHEYEYEYEHEYEHEYEYKRERECAHSCGSHLRSTCAQLVYTLRSTYACTIYTRAARARTRTRTHAHAQVLRSSCWICVRGLNKDFRPSG